MFTSVSQAGGRGFGQPSFSIMIRCVRAIRCKNESGGAPATAGLPPHQTNLCASAPLRENHWIDIADMKNP